MLDAQNTKLTTQQKNTEIEPECPLSAPADQSHPKQIKKAGIEVEQVKKTKKNEPKIFPSLMLVDKEAFESCGQNNTLFIMKQFWKSENNKILIGRKPDTQAIVGTAIFAESDPKDPRFNKKRLPSIYLLRIGVRINSQRQGIGRRMMNYLLEKYPAHPISLDVSTDNESAMGFYLSCGLRIRELYLSSPDNVEFALFESPLDKKGKKLNIKEQKNWDELTVQKYFDSVDSYKAHFKQEEDVTATETDESTKDQKIQILKKTVQITPKKLAEKSAKVQKGKKVLNSPSKPDFDKISCDTKSSADENSDKAPEPLVVNSKISSVEVAKVEILKNSVATEIAAPEKVAPLVLKAAPAMKLGNAFVPSFLKKGPSLPQEQQTQSQGAEFKQFQNYITQN